MYVVKNVLAAHKDKRVWFYLADESTSDAFRNALLAWKARWLDGTLLMKDDELAFYMAVHHDGHIAYVSNLVWHMARDPRYADSIIKIDYQKLLNKEDAIMEK